MDELHLLGGVCLVDPGSGSQIPLGGGQQQGLLAMLALASPRALTVNQIIDGLWGPEPPRSARNAIQVRINGLRKVLSPSGLAIETVAGGYALRGQVVIDTAQLRTLLERGRAELQGGQTARAVATLRQAADLASGTLCAGLEDHFPFLPAAVAEFQAKRVDALLELAAAELANGSLAAAAASATAVVQERPYDETAWSVHLRALYHQGRQVEALAACRQLRRTLADELGIEPGPAIRSLEQDILNHSLPPIDSLSGDETDQVPSGPSLPELVEPFVGRDDAVERVARTVADGARLVTLVGMGGIGKSTLAIAVSRRLAQQGQRVAYCALPAGLDHRSALLSACQTAQIPVTEDLVAALADFDGLLVLDDLPPGPDVAADIRAVLARPGRVRLLVTRRQVLDVPGEHSIQVEPLRELEDCVRLFTAAARRRGAELDLTRDGQAVEQICTRVDGIPLGIELAAARTRVMSPGQFAERLGRGEVSVLGTTGRADLRRVIADAVQPVIGTAGQEVLQLLATCSSGMSLDLVERLADGRDLALEEALGDLMDRGLCHHDDAGRFRLSGPVAEFARSLEDTTDADAALADTTARLAESLVGQLNSASAGQALERLEVDAAALEVALQRAFDNGDTSTATRLTSSLHRFWLMTGRLLPASRALSRCVELTDGAQAAWFRLLYGTFAGYRHQPETLELLASALRAAEEHALPPDRVYVNAWCTYSAVAIEGQSEGLALEAAHRAQDLAATSGSAELISLARDLTAFVHTRSGNHQKALDLRMECLAELRGDGTPYDLAAVLMNASDDLAQLGRPAEALEFADEALAVMPPGPTRLGTGGLIARAQAQALLGDTAAAEGTCAAVLAAIDDPSRDEVALADGLSIFAACLAMRGADDLAARAGAAANAWYADHGVAATRAAPPLLAELACSAKRLGSAHSTYAALGSSDPEATVRRLLAGQ
ncbi:BTAD domain-containing putative transcriptional regulator [Branchiibius sp. NY16-3462-2]|uniref:AfsR/SARP family transcriptional regulator n=1 Tax=Branchiibius sp. NY16-3462-2 TaxID=1807500 RepID=UPI000793834A|nr:BTAD domain-containing putative transcriptional regulator [Branchiibius sp. NY16-3462-2]KYH43009.1 hypothetical protein AZH51_06040 [Branchiibius sp. NY16-3462-2]